MSEIKVIDLTNTQLDEWVARARGWTIEQVGHIRPWVGSDGNTICTATSYSPTSNPAQWAELIDEFIHGLDKEADIDGFYWTAWATHGSSGQAIPQTGPTPAIAICRAVVCSAFGDTVPSLQGGASKFGEYVELLDGTDNR